MRLPSCLSKGLSDQLYPSTSELSILLWSDQAGKGRSGGKEEEKRSLLCRPSVTRYHSSGSDNGVTRLP